MLSVDLIEAMGSREQAAQIIDTIVSQAEAVWGDRYLIELVRRYCEIESSETGKEVKPVKRRSQLVRALEEKTCELTTLMRLLSATGIEIELYIRKKL